MPPALINDIMIDEVVYDYMVVRVTNPALQELTLQYSINHKEKNIVIRKGSFKGQVIQLRVSHMSEGFYNFYIAPEGLEPLIIPFEKRSESFEHFHSRR